MTVQRWLLVATFVVALVIGVTTMPQRSRAADNDSMPPPGPQAVLMIKTELGWMRYISPKGYIAVPRSVGACEVDRASVANLRQGFVLECRPAR